jgi:hypothetical protein
MSREDIFTALFALAPNVQWDSGGFQSVSRRLRLWDDTHAKPALMQVEHEEQYAQATRLPYKRIFKAEWWIYHTAGNDPDAVPTITTNQILDAIEAALAPAVSDPGFPDERNTLGGLVHHCFLNGKVTKVSGDLDGAALVTVPITILAP